MINSKITIILLLLSACIIKDKVGTSKTKSYIKNSTPYPVGIKFFKKDSVMHYLTLNIKANDKILVSDYYDDGKSSGYSYYAEIIFDDSIVFQFNTDTFLTHYNRQIDTTNKNGFGITWPNNIFNPNSFKLSKIKEKKRYAEYEYVYEITNQDFLKARK